MRGWTVGDVIDRYIEDVKPHNQWGVDKDSALKMLKTKLGPRSLSSFSKEMVLAFAYERQCNGVGSTISGNLSYLSTVVKYARNALRLDIPVDVVSEARSVLVDNGLMTQPKERERHPCSRKTLRSCPEISCRYRVAMLFVFKAQQEAHSGLCNSCCNAEDGQQGKQNR